MRVFSETANYGSRFTGDASQLRAATELGSREALLTATHRCASKAEVVGSRPLPPIAAQFRKLQNMKTRRGEEQRVNSFPAS